MAVIPTRKNFSAVRTNGFIYRSAWRKGQEGTPLYHHSTDGIQFSLAICLNAAVLRLLGGGQRGKPEYACRKMANGSSAEFRAIFWWERRAGQL